MQFKLVIKNFGFRAATNCTATMNIKEVEMQDVYLPTSKDCETHGSGGTLITPDYFVESPRDLGDESIPWDLGLMEPLDSGQTFSIT
ncbi:hypothetical protein ACFLYR_06030 [Chloroflexota bacterium]